MAEFVLVKGVQIQIPPDFIEVGAEAVEAFHATVLAGKSVPTELLIAGTDEVATSSDVAAVRSAERARVARLGRIASWAKQNQPVKPAAPAAEAASDSARAPKSAAKAQER